MRRFDVLIVGGGPAGSAAARVLARAGKSVAVLDRQQFPRVKPCGGWLSPGVWEELGMSPEQYPRSLWRWRRCHVQYAGHRHSVAGSGYFIRRYELDDFLLARSGAEVMVHPVQRLERRDGLWCVDAKFAAPVLIGAGGTYCPVARRAFLEPRGALVAAQEHEFVAGGALVAATRVGADGEPELLLHDDLGGYSWNVPKGGWLNVGTGTSDPHEVRAAWSAAREFFLDSGHLPAMAAAELTHARGHAYYLFDPAHLAACERDSLLVVGDALGLAHPLTGEGILPAVISGRLAAEAVLGGTSYRRALEQNLVIRDYAFARAVLTLAIALRRASHPGAARPAVASAVAPRWQVAAARGFARLFSGKRVFGSNLLGGALLRARRGEAAKVQP